MTPPTLGLDRASAVLTLPVLDGPSPIQERPVLPPPDVEHANRSPKERDKPEDESKGSVRWEVSHEQLKHETRAYAGSFGDYEASEDVPAFAELYDGVVAVSTDDPGTARAHGEARFTLRFPEATCESHVTVKLDSDKEAYRSVRWTKDDIRELEYASLLHDFGKIGVREEVLVKAKKLFAYEIENSRLRFDFAIRSAETDVLRQWYFYRSVYEPRKNS